MKSKWMDYLGQKVLYIDLSNFNDDERSFDEELTQTVTTIGQEMYKMPPYSVPVLVDLRHTKMTSRTQKLVSERITDTRKFVSRTAVIGLTGIRQVFLDFFARLAHSETQPFDTPEAGLEWLVTRK